MLKTVVIVLYLYFIILFIYYNVAGNEETKGNISTEKFSHFPELGKLVESLLTIFIFLLAVKPTLHDVLMKLACISASWREIGYGLRLSHNNLKYLAESNLSKETRLGEVIQLWLNMNGQGGGAPVTWMTILNVLEGPLVNKKALAMEIYQSLKEESCNEQIAPSKYTIDS